MQSSYDPQIHVASTSAAPAASSAQPVIGSSAASAKRPGRFLVLRRALRLLLRRWLYAMTLLFRWVRPFAGFAAVIVVLLIAMSWMAVSLWWPSSAPAQDVRVAALPPSSSIQTYLQGQQSYNADLLWQAYSPAFQAAELQRGVDKRIMQDHADSERQSGLRYGHADYIGGVKLNNGHSMYFYTVDLTIASQQVKAPFIFIADPKGAIVRVQPPFLPPAGSNE